MTSPNRNVPQLAEFTDLVFRARQSVALKNVGKSLSNSDRESLMHDIKTFMEINKRSVCDLCRVMLFYDLTSRSASWKNIETIHNRIDDFDYYIGPMLDSIVANLYSHGYSSQKASDTVRNVHSEMSFYLPLVFPTGATPPIQSPQTFVNLKQYSKESFILYKNLLVNPYVDVHSLYEVLSQLSPNTLSTILVSASMWMLVGHWLNVIECGERLAKLGEDDIPLVDPLDGTLLSVHSTNLADYYIGMGLLHTEGKASMGMVKLRKFARIETGEPQPLIHHALYNLGLMMRGLGKEISDKEGDETAHFYFNLALGSTITSNLLGVTMKDTSVSLDKCSTESLATRSDPLNPASGKSLAELKKEGMLGVRKTAYDDFWVEFNKLIGMVGVREQITTLESMVRAQQMRSKFFGETNNEDASKSANAKHILFLGPPGTGKTVVARLWAKFLFGLNLVPEEKFIECSKQHFVGQHVGDTEAITKNLLDQGKGGVIFIDEAYTLAPEGASANDFGKIALDIIMAFAENNREDTAIILAGYEHEIEYLLSSNPGLQSRFTTRIKFSAYPPEDLGAILKIMADTSTGTARFMVSPEVVNTFVELCRKNVYRDIVDSKGVTNQAINILGNGRFVRDVAEKARGKRDLRISANTDMSQLTEEFLLSLNEDDITSSFFQLASNVLR